MLNYYSLLDEKMEDYFFHWGRILDTIWSAGAGTIQDIVAYPSPFFNIFALHGKYYVSRASILSVAWVNGSYVMCNLLILFNKRLHQWSPYVELMSQCIPPFGVQLWYLPWLWSTYWQDKNTRTQLLAGKWSFVNPSICNFGIERYIKLCIASGKLV